MKTIVLDVETTGLDPINDDIIQLSCIILENGIEIDSFDEKLKPRAGRLPSTISKEALELAGITIEQLRTFELPEVVFNKFLTFLKKHVPYKAEKLTLAGQNVCNFDKFFIDNFFKMYAESAKPYYYFKYHMLDTMIIANFMAYCGIINVENFKLETLCKNAGINLIAHNAINDVRAVYQLLQHYKQYIPECL